MLEDPIKLATGYSLIPAHEVMKPSGPKISLILTLAIVIRLRLGICLALYSPVGFASSALRAGVPSPVSDIDANPEAMGEHGFYFKAGDVSDF